MCRITLLVNTQFKFKLKLKYKITGRCYLGNLEICVLFCSISERGHRHFVIWCSSYSNGKRTGTKCPKTVKVRVKVTREVGRIPRATKRIFVCIRLQHTLQCNSVQYCSKETRRRSSTFCNIKRRSELDVGLRRAGPAPAMAFSGETFKSSFQFT
jgi:hypothetical protein